MNEFAQEIRVWAEKNPRLYWAFEQLDDTDELRDRVLAGIIKEDMPPAAIDDLVRFTDGLENRERAETAGTVSAPPGVGMRRPINIVVTRMTKVNWNRDKMFRVDFVTEHGWSGYFDTKNPRLVERVSKAQNKSLTVVGEVERHLYDFLVVLGGRVRAL